MKLFLFRAIGSYVGGCAGATAKNEKSAFKILKEKYTIPFECCSFYYESKKLEKIIKRESKTLKDEVYLDSEEKIRKEIENELKHGWVCFEQLDVNKDVLFCEYHGG